MVNDAVFAYAVQSNDSPSTVASNLAALLRAAGWLVDYAGQTIGVAGAERFYRSCCERGRITARDQASGTAFWYYNVVPGPGFPGRRSAGY